MFCHLGLRRIALVVGALSAEEETVATLAAEPKLA
jgi:hypothetical protein